MFFDPIEVDRGPGGARRAVSRRHLLRFTFVLALLLASLLDPAARLARRATSAAAWGEMPPWAPTAFGAGALFAGAAGLVRFRGFAHVALGALTAGAAWWLTRRADAGSELVALVGGVGGELSTTAAWGFARAGATVAAGVWGTLLFWWAFGKALGWGGWFGLPPHTWADPLLGSPCRPNLPRNLIIGYVVYHDWSVFEEVVAGNPVGPFALPVRAALLPSDAEVGAVDDLTEGEWVLVAGSVSVLSLLPNARCAVTTARATTAELLSLIDPALDGFRAARTPLGARPSGRKVDLFDEARRRSVHNDRVVQATDPSFSIVIAVPDHAYLRRTGSPPLLRVAWRAGQVVLQSCEYGGYRFEPFGSRPLERLPTSLLELLCAKSDRSLLRILDPVGTDEYDEVLTALAEFLRRQFDYRWQVRAGASRPEAFFPLLTRWLPHVAMPVGTLANDYLSWATNPDAKLIKSMTFDPYSGGVENESHRLIDLGSELAVTALADGTAVLLPVPDGSLELFSRCLKQLARTRELFHQDEG